LFVLSINDSKNKRRHRYWSTLTAQRLFAGENAVAGPAGEPEDGRYLMVHYIGPELNSPSLMKLEMALNSALGVKLEPFYYASEKFNALKSEGRGSAVQPSEQEVGRAMLLRDANVRSLVTAIAKSGGLLLRDLPKALTEKAQPEVDRLQKALLSAGLIESAVVCKRTQDQTVRVGSRDVLQQMSEQGLQCACGRPIADERIEEALTMTEEGRALLDKSRWMTLLVVHEPLASMDSHALLRVLEERAISKEPAREPSVPMAQNGGIQTAVQS